MFKSAVTNRLIAHVPFLTGSKPDTNAVVQLSIELAIKSAMKVQSGFYEPIWTCLRRYGCAPEKVSLINQALAATSESSLIITRGKLYKLQRFFVIRWSGYARI
jgi:hypothetical protein